MTSQTASQTARSLPADPATLIEADRVLRSQVGISVRRVRANLRAVVAAATPAQVASGRRWYGLAQVIARHLDVTYHLPIGTGACLIAAYSPRTRWSDNVRHATHTAAQVIGYGYGYAVFTPPAGVMGANYARALRVIAAAQAAQRSGLGPAATWEALTSALGQGPKVKAFAHNCHGLEMVATIDVWAMRAALKPNWKRGDDMTQAESALSRKGVYGALHLAYAAEARLAGLSTAEYQAVVWCAISDYTA